MCVLFIFGVHFYSYWYPLLYVSIWSITYASEGFTHKLFAILLLFLQHTLEHTPYPSPTVFHEGNPFIRGWKGMTTGYVPFPQLHFCLKTSSISVISGGSRASAWCRGGGGSSNMDCVLPFQQGTVGGQHKILQGWMSMCTFILTGTFGPSWRINHCISWASLTF